MLKLQPSKKAGTRLAQVLDGNEPDQRTETRMARATATRTAKKEDPGNLLLNKYLKTMGRIPLLSREDEVEVYYGADAHQDIGRCACRSLRKQYLPILADACSATCSLQAAQRRRRSTAPPPWVVAHAP